MSVSLLGRRENFKLSVCVFNNRNVRNISFHSPTGIVHMTVLVSNIIGASLIHSEHKKISNLMLN